MSSARPVNAGSFERVLPDIEPSHPGSSVDLARLPAAAAAASPPSLVGRVAAAQSPEERILAELERENDFTPLRLCLLQFRNLGHPAERLQRVSDWMRDLHSKTTQRKNKSTAPLTLRELRQLQEEIMNANLKSVGKLWGRSCHCFVSADQVRGWLRLYPEEFRAKLASPSFCANLGEFCTFIPPEVAQLVWTDETWGQIAGGNFSRSTGRVNEALFQEIATWKGQSMSGEMVVRCFATFVPHLQFVPRHLRSVHPLLLYLCSFLERRPVGSLSFEEWNTVGETMVSLIVEKQLHIPAFIELFSARREAFGRNWGEFAARVCWSYSNSTTDEERVYFSQLVRFFLSEPERLSVEKLVGCCTTLTLHSQHVDESVLQRCVEVLERIPLTQALEMQLAAVVIEKIEARARDRTIQRLLDLPISDQALLNCMNNRVPIEAQFCIHSLEFQRPILDTRMRVLRELNQYRPGHFEHDLAVHQASLAAWNEGWAEPARAPTPPPANDSTTASKCCGSG